MTRWAFTLLIALFCLSSTWAQAGKLGGQASFDLNGNAVSGRTRTIDRLDEPFAGMAVALHDSAGLLDAEATDPAGRFEFFDLPQGRYLIEPLPGEDVPVCLSHNRPRRLFDAIHAGQINLVAFGDSNGTSGSDVLYPERLAGHLADFADVNLVNVSSAGSTAEQWAAPGGLFDTRLAGHLPDADLVIFTLGGNDIKNHFGGLPPYDFEGIIADLVSFPAAYGSILADIRAVIDRVRAANPDADVLCIIYFNFANSPRWQSACGPLWPLVRFGVRLFFGQLRWALEKDPDLILVDVMGATGYDQDIGGYLADMMHPNDLGHQLYADEAFFALGGAIIDQGGAVGIERGYAFEPIVSSSTEVLTGKPNHSAPALTMH